MGVLDGVSLLIAEDESAGAIYCASAKQEGADAVHVRTVSDAIELLRLRSFDAAWIDLGMPSTSLAESVLHTAILGSSVIREIRKYKDPTFIFVMTGNRDAESARDFLVEWGVGDYFTKRALFDKGYGFVWNRIHAGVSACKEEWRAVVKKSTVKLLFGEDDDTFLFSRMTSSLGKGFTLPVMKKSIDFLSKQILPLRENEYEYAGLRVAGAPLQIEYGVGYVSARGWSAKMGGRVELKISSSDEFIGEGKFEKLGEFMVVISII